MRVILIYARRDDTSSSTCWAPFLLASLCWKSSVDDLLNTLTNWSSGLTHGSGASSDIFILFFFFLRGFSISISPIPFVLPQKMSRTPIQMCQHLKSIFHNSRCGNLSNWNRLRFDLAQSIAHRLQPPSIAFVQLISRTWKKGRKTLINFATWPVRSGIRK